MSRAEKHQSVSQSCRVHHAPPAAQRLAGSNTCWLPRHLDAVNNWRGWTPLFFFFFLLVKCKAGKAPVGD